jgi:hypothetical protein
LKIFQPTCSFHRKRYWCSSLSYHSHAMMNLIITAFLQKLGIERNYIEDKNTIFNSLYISKIHKLRECKICEHILYVFSRVRSHRNYFWPLSHWNSSNKIKIKDLQFLHGTSQCCRICQPSKQGDNFTWNAVAQDTFRHLMLSLTPCRWTAAWHSVPVPNPDATEWNQSGFPCQHPGHLVGTGTHSVELHCSGITTEDCLRHGHPGNCFHTQQTQNCS